MATEREYHKVPQFRNQYIFYVKIKFPLIRVALGTISVNNDQSGLWGNEVASVGRLQYGEGHVKYLVRLETNLVIDKVNFKASHDFVCRYQHIKGGWGHIKISYELEGGYASLYFHY